MLLFHQFVNIYFHSLFSDSVSSEVVSFPACPLRGILEEKPDWVESPGQGGTAELRLGMVSVQTTAEYFSDF